MTLSSDRGVRWCLRPVFAPNKTPRDSTTRCNPINYTMYTGVHGCGEFRVLCFCIPIHVREFTLDGCANLCLAKCGGNEMSSVQPPRYYRSVTSELIRVVHVGSPQAGNVGGPDEFLEFNMSHTRSVLCSLLSHSLSKITRSPYRLQSNLSLSEIPDKTLRARSCDNHGLHRSSQRRDALLEC